jgi:hypothetical protein
MDVRGYTRIACCACKVDFLIPTAVFEVLVQREEDGIFYCPHGHTQYIPKGKTEIEKLREALNQERIRVKNLEQSCLTKDEAIRKGKSELAKYKPELSSLKRKDKIHADDIQQPEINLSRIERIHEKRKRKTP